MIVGRVGSGLVVVGGGGVVDVGFGVDVLDVGDEVEDDVEELLDSLEDSLEDSLVLELDELDELEEDEDLVVVGRDVVGGGACVVVIGGGALLGGLVCGRYLTLPAGGRLLTGSPSSAPIM